MGSRDIDFDILNNNNTNNNTIGMYENNFKKYF